MDLGKKLDFTRTFLNEAFPNLKINAYLGGGTPDIRCFIDITDSFSIGWDEELSTQLITNRVEKALEAIKQLIDCSLDEIEELEEKGGKCQG